MFEKKDAPEKKEVAEKPEKPEKPVAHGTVGHGAVGHNTTYPYPNLAQFQEAVPVVLAKLRGEETDRNSLIHAAYAVEGFALGMLFPHAPVMFNSDVSLSVDTKNQLREMLEHQPNTAGVTRTPSAGARFEAGALPWKSILTIILQLLGQLLAS